uniref:Fibronectin type-III domain-containing protein n=1 Tax=Steinernema glaseri TaxID=37863 RepID=A0A1I7YXV5_9BILA
MRRELKGGSSLKCFALYVLRLRFVCSGLEYPFYDAFVLGPKTTPNPTFLLRTLPSKFAIPVSGFSPSARGFDTTLAPLATAEELLTSLAKAFFSTETSPSSSTTTTQTTPKTTSATSTTTIITTTAAPARPVSSTTTTSTTTITPTTISTVSTETTPYDSTHTALESESATSFTEDLSTEETSDPIATPHSKETHVYGSNPNYEAYSNPPSYIYAQKTGGQVRMDWDVPETTLCDTYFVNYTVLTAEEPKTLSVASPDPFIHTKMFSGHKVEVSVHHVRARFRQSSVGSFKEPRAHTKY